MGPLPSGVLAAVPGAVASTLPLLIEGETGTGKTYLARCLHDLGSRAARPFIHVNCPNLAGNLLEAELFGHERGAYTDAREMRRGLVETAHRGTLFLDEIAEIRPPDQARLLTLLEEGCIRRIGGNRAIPIDVRVICATNRQLSHLLANGAFRHDLFYRIALLRLRIPALRERRDELPGIASHLLDGISASDVGIDRIVSCAIEDAAIVRLLAHDWPGNVRELRNVLIRSLIESGGRGISADCIDTALADAPELPHGAVPPATSMAPKPRYAAQLDRRQERQRIVAVLKAASGNKRRAARELGMSRQTLYDRIARYQIDEEEWHP